ncbi:MAG: flagellar biosynthetic protein FliR [Spirochaetaceae bacterium]|nr:flagellar biosynthetic protein FliR [Spirochaetaceae bacterium]
MLNELVAGAQLFFLLFVRITAMIAFAPLLSSGSIPRIAKIALALMSAALVFPMVQASGYPIPDSGLAYAVIAIGEAMIGIIMGFILAIIYAAFQTAGQMFSLQMGFGASQVFDPLAQIEIPLMGQFLNLVAMFVFVFTQGFQKIFLTGVYYSFQSVRAVDLVLLRDDLLTTMLRGLSELFQNALIIALPILGTLFLIQIVMGLLGKAAPQMNLLVMGFPISIGVAFIIILVTIPFLMESFDRLIGVGFDHLMVFFRGAAEVSP